MNKIRLGVVGVGYLGAFHVEKCARLSMAELTAISEVNPERCTAIAAQYQTQGFTDYRQLIGKVDAVCVVVPAIHHYEVAHFFLSHGIHVFLEKPMATNPNDAKDLVALSKQNKCLLQIGFIERFNPVTKKLKELIKSPKIVECSRLASYSPRGTDVSVILDLMIHDLDLINCLFDRPLQLQTASGCRVESESLDEVTAHFSTSNNINIYVTASRISQQKQREMRIVEEDRVIHADFGNSRIEIYSTLAPQQLPERIELPKQDLLMEELHAFATAIATQQTAQVTGEMGEKALVLAANIQSKVEQGMHAKEARVGRYREVLST